MTMPQTKSSAGADASPLPPDLWKAFPRTRYQGSKRKLLPFLYEASAALNFSTVCDLYAGTGTVSLLFRVMGKQVRANDYLAFNANAADLMLNIDNSVFDVDYAALLEELLNSKAPRRCVQKNYHNIFFTDAENQQIDNFAQNSAELTGRVRQLLVYAVGQALLKKRPYNLFHRANLDMRMRNVRRSFGNATTWATPIYDHAIQEIVHLSRFDFDCYPPAGSSCQCNTSDLQSAKEKIGSADLVYLDPPYLNRRSAPINYADFYHFLEGLWDYRLFEKPKNEYPHRPIVTPTSRWNRASTALEELQEIPSAWPESIIVLSYRNDGVPSENDAIDALSVNGRRARIYHAESYKYALSKSTSTKENIIISSPASTEKVR